MKMTVLVDNIGTEKLPGEWGLSLYIEHNGTCFTERFRDLPGILHGMRPNNADCQLRLRPFATAYGTGAAARITI